MAEENKVAARLTDGMLRGMIKAYYDLPGNSTGGSLHIVLDDMNIERRHVEFCLNYAKDKGDVDGALLAEQLICLTEEELAALLDPYDIYGLKYELNARS